VAPEVLGGLVWISGRIRRLEGREATMPTVVATHEVKDVDHWLSSPKRAELLGPLGVTNLRTFVNPTDRTHVSLSMDVSDMDAMMAALQSEAGAAAMEYDGVLGETLVLYVQE
jgi:hypothetical protein